MRQRLQGLFHHLFCPDYDYDIHVSYRFNDNKYDGWVTQFVEKLNQELSATLKDKLSIFFDKDLKNKGISMDQGQIKSNR